MVKRLIVAIMKRKIIARMMGKMVKNDSVMSGRPIICARRRRIVVRARYVRVNKLVALRISLILLMFIIFLLPLIIWDVRLIKDAEGQFMIFKSCPSGGVS